MTPYDELELLFNQLTPNDKYYLICRYVLNAEIKHLAKLSHINRTTLQMRICQAANILKKNQTHDEMIAGLQALFELWLLRGIVVKYK